MCLRRFAMPPAQGARSRSRSRSPTPPGLFENLTNAEQGRILHLQVRNTRAILRTQTVLSEQVQALGGQNLVLQARVDALEELVVSLIHLLVSLERTVSARETDAAS